MKLPTICLLLLTNVPLVLVSEIASMNCRQAVHYFLTYLVEHPSPGSYRVASDFEITDARRTKAFTFGTSRDAYEHVYNPAVKVSTDRSIPGPGAYSILSTIGKESRKFSLQGRTPYIRGKHLNFNFYLQTLSLLTRRMESQDLDNTTPRLT